MNDCGANRLQKGRIVLGRIVLGTNCLGGESLLGRIVYEGSDSSRGRIVLGAERTGGETSRNPFSIPPLTLLYPLSTLLSPTFLSPLPLLCVSHPLQRSPYRLWGGGAIAPSPDPCTRPCLEAACTGGESSTKGAIRLGANCLEGGTNRGRNI